MTPIFSSNLSDEVEFICNKLIFLMRWIGFRCGEEEMDLESTSMQVNELVKSNFNVKILFIFDFFKNIFPSKTGF